MIIVVDNILCLVFANLVQCDQTQTMKKVCKLAAPGSQIRSLTSQPDIVALILLGRESLCEFRASRHGHYL